jgi:hypothetical protein
VAVWNVALAKKTSIYKAEGVIMNITTSLIIPTLLLEMSKAKLN